MSELSRFVYVKSRVTLHVKFNAEKVNCHLSRVVKILKDTL